MNELLGTLNKLTKTVTQTSGTVLKSTKLSMALSGEEDSLKAVYVDIGKKVHEIYLYGGNLGKFFDEKYAEITEIEKRIGEIKEQLDIVKGTKTCPKCNKRVEKNADFCQKCGYKMGSGTGFNEKNHVASEEPKTKQFDEAAVEAIPIATALPQESNSLTRCRICGDNNPNGSKFCLSCGRIL